MNIDIKDIITNNMLVQLEIRNESYPSLHSNGDKMILPSDGQETIQDVLNGGKKILSKVEDDPLSKAKRSMEYFVVGLKKSLSSNQEFMISLSKTVKSEVFEYPCIMSIIDFKWKTYCRSYFLH
jgi:hypothetical protein